MEGEEGGRDFLCSHLRKWWCDGLQVSPVVELTMPASHLTHPTDSAHLTNGTLHQTIIFA